VKNRFEDREALIESLCSQKVIQGNRLLAGLLADAGELVECQPGKNLIEQGQSEQDVYFILAGQLRIIINEVRLHTRNAGENVGEMSALNHTIPRSATLSADELTIALRVSASAYKASFDEHPQHWRHVASDLAGRIEQRNKYVNRANLRPRIFIVSSKEALDEAEEIRLGLSYEGWVVELWSDDQIFPSGSYPLDVLEEAVSKADFCIAIASGDDLVRARDREQLAPRDNVIFELGFFMSRIGRARTMLLVPKGKSIKIPSDYKGVTPIPYDDNTTDQNLSTALGPTITSIKKTVRGQGVRSSMQAVK